MLSYKLRIHSLSVHQFYLLPKRNSIFLVCVWMMMCRGDREGKRVKSQNTEIGEAGRYESLVLGSRNKLKKHNQYLRAVWSLCC